MGYHVRENGIYRDCVECSKGSSSLEVLVLPKEIFQEACRKYCECANNKCNCGPYGKDANAVRVIPDIKQEEVGIIHCEDCVNLKHSVYDAGHLVAGHRFTCALSRLEVNLTDYCSRAVMGRREQL